SLAPSGRKGEGVAAAAAPHRPSAKIVPQLRDRAIVAATDGQERICYAGGRDLRHNGPYAGAEEGSVQGRHRRRGEELSGARRCRGGNAGGNAKDRQVQRRRDVQRALGADPGALNQISASSVCLSMIFSENRFPLFGIML